VHICIAGYLKQCVWITVVCVVVLVLYKNINSKLFVVFIALGEDTKDDMEMMEWIYDSLV